MSEQEKFQMDETIQQTLDRLLQRIATSNIIQEYQDIEAKVAAHTGLVEMTDEIKRYQKEAVKCAHYGKPEAEKQAIKQADDLTKAFDEHPLVLRYREKLMEANDLLQHVTTLIEEQVNIHLELTYEDLLQAKLKEK